MPRETPSWWYDESRFMPAVLSPVSGLWTLAARLRQMLANPYQSALPVICVGNLTAGGAGKTPAALAIAHFLHQLDFQPAFLTRGYGGEKTGPHIVDADRDTARDVGDEALLLAKVAPVIVSADRAKGARLAETVDADVVVMDDGFQNPGLHKTLSLLVVDRSTGIGNGRVIPAGPLRAPLGGQLNRAQAIIAVGRGTAADGVIAKANELGLPVFDAMIEPKSKAKWLSEKPVVAFAGIGNPSKFFKTLEDCGAQLAGRVAFPDHHPFSRAEADELLLRAKDAGAQLVTTEKDNIRLSARSDLQHFRRSVKAFPVRMLFRDRGKLKRLLARTLGRG